MSRRRQQTVPETGGAQDASGVKKTTRSEGLEGNRRDPTPRPTSGEGGAYKPNGEGVPCGEGVRGAHCVRWAAHWSGGLKSLRRPGEGRCIQKRE